MDGLTDTPNMTDVSELWADVVGHEGIYQVSSLGNVKRVKRSKGSHGKNLKPTLSGSGYRKVCFSVGMKKTQRNLHRVVAEAFIPNPLDLPEVDHIDGNRSNNRADNLQWVSRSQNRCFSWSRGNRVVDPAHMARMQAARWSN